MSLDNDFIPCHLTREMYNYISICKGMVVHFYIVFKWLIIYYYILFIFVLLFIILYLLIFLSCMAL